MEKHFRREAADSHNLSQSYGTLQSLWRAWNTVQPNQQLYFSIIFVFLKQHGSSQSKNWNSGSLTDNIKIAL